MFILYCNFRIIPAKRNVEVMPIDETPQEQEQNRTLEKSVINVDDKAVFPRSSRGSEKRDQSARGSIAELVRRKTIGMIHTRKEKEVSSDEENQLEKETEAAKPKISRRKT